MEMMTDMSNTVKTETGIEVYENKIEEYLDQYIQEHDIENMNKETQSRWNAALLYINKYVFKGQKDKLRTPGNVNNSYDLELINELCDIYINLCYEYDKEVSILGFSKLTGINQDTFHDWGNEDRKSVTYYDKNNNIIPSINLFKVNHPGEPYRQELGSSGREVYKKLNVEREESLSNKLISGKQNPIGILGTLNRHYGWNMGQPRGAERKNQQSIEQIRQSYGMQEQAEQPLLSPPESDFS